MKRAEALRPWRRRFSRAIFESALIVFSVLLALVLNEWRDSRKHAERTELAVEAIVAELRGNREAAERAMKRHRSVTTTLTNLSNRSQLPTNEFVQSGIFNPANLVETAWTSAREAGAVDEWPYDLVLEVSGLYERQAAYNNLARQLNADLYMDLRRRGFDAVLRQEFAGIILLTRDFANREAGFLHEYDETLAALEKHTGR